MTIPIDTSNDWQIVEGMESVTFFSRQQEGSVYDSGTITQAKRMPLSKAMMEASEELLLFGITWHVWKILMGGVTPKFGDRILDTLGIGYQVKKVEVVSLGNRFRLTCLQEQ